MMVPLILLVLVRSMPSLSTSREYHFVNLEKSWPEAQAYCRENFVDLATIESEEDWAMVQEVESKFGYLHSWMGLYEDVNDWRWSVDGALLDYAEISSLSQSFNTHKEEMHCVSWFNSEVQDNTCDNEYYSVCYDEPSGSYIPVRDPMTWEAAQSYCRGTYTDLTSLRSSKEQLMVTEVADIGSHWWIGLSRGPRKWSDGSNSTFRPWDGGQPGGLNHDCGCTAVGGWHDCGCSWLLTFICSTPTAAVFKIGLKTGGSVDLNDPQTQEGVLVQMGKQMRSHRVLPEFRLRWMSHSDGEILHMQLTVAP